MPTPAFELFGKQHLATLLLLAGLGFLVALTGKRGEPSVRTRLGRALGLLLVTYAIARYAELAYHGQLSWDYGLPLELCHWVLIACAMASFFQNQLASEIAYFWGLGGTLQALLTPDLAEGFPSWNFLQFFWAHGGVLLSVVYLLAARGFRPRAGSVLRMMLAANAYLLLVGSLDMIFGWNYGYLRHPPYQPSLLDYLGPWPWYILSLELVALASFWILALPWKISRQKTAEEANG